jgi:UDP-N-acetylmuramyl pentapeptide phosphotransferase/UDP-N-acetylglucosamine-1-phosphate transferase
MEQNIQFLLSFSLSFGSSLVFTNSIIRVAERKKLFDDNNSLKRHLERVCSLGGIAIFSAFWIAFIAAASAVLPPMLGWLLAGSFILFLTGVNDDLVGLPALRRLGIQIGVATLLFACGVRVSFLPGIESELPLWVSYILTIGMMGAIVNAYNFIDGINGLAGGLAMIASIAYAGIFLYAGNYDLVCLSLALAGSVAGFLRFNFGNAKIFMGDNGSTFIGIVLSFLTILFLGKEIQDQLSPVVSPAIALSFLFVPVVDMLKVIVGRLRCGKSPFRGDRTHIHHVFDKKGYGQRSTCFYLFGWTVLVIVFSLFLLPDNFYLAIGLLLIVGGVPYAILNTLKHPSTEKKTMLKVTDIKGKRNIQRIGTANQQ